MGILVHSSFCEKIAASPQVFEFRKTGKPNKLVRNKDHTIDTREPSSIF